MAAFLARYALEQIMDQRCTELGARASWAITRSKLAVLRSLDTEEAADSAATAWNRLSSAAMCTLLNGSRRPLKFGTMRGHGVATARVNQVGIPR